MGRDEKLSFSPPAEGQLCEQSRLVKGWGGLIHIGLVTVMLQTYVGGDLEEDPMRQKGKYRLKRRMFCSFCVGKGPVDL